MSVVNVKVKYIRPEYNNLKEWCEDPNNLYIGRRGIVFIDKQRYPPRDSPWCNPYKIGRDGDWSEVSRKFRDHIMSKINNKEVDLEELRGKNLGCWCTPNDCHGNILLELLELSDQ